MAMFVFTSVGAYTKFILVDVSLLLKNFGLNAIERLDTFESSLSQPGRYDTDICNSPSAIPREYAQVRKFLRFQDFTGRSWPELLPRSVPRPSPRNCSKYHPHFLFRLRSCSNGNESSQKAPKQVQSFVNHSNKCSP